MPRSAAKSQADKRRSASSAQVITPPVPDLEVVDIIPGRLTQVQWTDMLIQEDAAEAVGEIMEELLSRVMEGCFKVYVERELVPFSASWAKSYLTHILEQQFMCLDEGEGPEEASTTEDSEPLPVTLDPWAQGCVPVQNVTPQPTSQKEVDLGQIPQRTKPVNQRCHVVSQTNSSPKQAEKEKNPKRPVRDKHSKVLCPCPSPKVDQKKKQQLILSPKPFPHKLLPPLSRSAEKKDAESDSKNRTHSVLNQSTGSLYWHKDYQLLPRIDPSRLPRHSILPQYEILDNNCTQPNSKKENKYKKQQTEWTGTSLKPPTSSRDQQEKFQSRSEAEVFLKTLSPSGHGKEGMVYPGPLRLDTMELAKGVSLLGPHAIDMNAFTFKPPTLSAKLKPIQSEAGRPLYSAEQVTIGPPPPQVTTSFQSDYCE